MNVQDLMDILARHDPEMLVVTRIAHCCGQDGASEDAVWLPQVGITRVARDGNGGKVECLLIEGADEGRPMGHES